MEVSLQAGWKERWWPWILFTLLILAGASRWMVAGVQPDAESTPASLALGCGWAALVGLLLIARGPAPVTLYRSWLVWVLAGVLLFAGPAAGVLLHARELDAAGLTMALSLTPVAVGIAAAAFGTGSRDGAAGRIWPGLAAVGGLLLLLAEPNLGNVKADLATVLAPVLTGVGAALFCSEKTVSPWRAVAAISGGMAVFAVVVAADALLTATRPAVSLLAVACDGLMALLSVYTLLRVGAERWSARFTLLPLLIALEGIVLVRPAVTARWVVGLALLLLASVYLLLPTMEDPETGPAITPR